MILFQEEWNFKGDFVAHSGGGRRKHVTHSTEGTSIRTTYYSCIPGGYVGWGESMQSIQTNLIQIAHLYIIEMI